MKVPTRGRQFGLRFNITPLIDVVLLLIIFFLAASHLVRSESLQPVELPRARQAESEAAQSPRRLVLTVTEEPQLYVSGRPVSLQDVEQMILAGRQDAGEMFEVRIRSDRRVPYREIEPILLVCARAGVTKVGFAVLKE